MIYFTIFYPSTKNKKINENSNNNYDSTNKSRYLFICCLNTIGSKQEISTTRAISYLLNLPDHIIDHDFIYIPWYNLSAWANEQEKNQMFKTKTIMIIMSTMKISWLIKNHQINNISYTILRSITNKNLLTLIFHVHMNFLIKQIKSTTSVVINLIMNTLNTTPTTFMNSKFQEFQFYKITQHLHKNKPPENYT